MSSCRFVMRQRAERRVRGLGRQAVVVVIERSKGFVEPTVGHPGRYSSAATWSAGEAEPRFRGVIPAMTKVQADVTSAIAPSAIRSWTYCRSRIASRWAIRTPTDGPTEPGPRGGSSALRRSAAALDSLANGINGVPPFARVRSRLKVQSVREERSPDS